jgi:hypothetical protein
MLRHARAMILLGGWLLMYPPFTGSKPDRAASIMKWEQYGAYDSAVACETDRVYATKRADGGFLEALRDARCVPAESIYPPQPAAQR